MIGKHSSVYIVCMPSSFVHFLKQQMHACEAAMSLFIVNEFENNVIFLPNDNRVLNFVPNVINLYTFI